MKADENGVLLEQIIHQNEAILEIVGDMQKNVAKIPVIEEKIDKLEKNMQTVKLAVTDTNKDVQNLKRRVTVLETAA